MLRLPEEVDTFRDLLRSVCTLLPDTVRALPVSSQAAYYLELEGHNLPRIFCEQGDGSYCYVRSKKDNDQWLTGRG